jgi:hypothetical protein
MEGGAVGHNFARNPPTNINQILLKRLLDGPLPKLCPLIPTSNQDGRQAKNRKKGEEIKKKSCPRKILSQYQPSFAEKLGGHLGWKSGSTDTILEGGHPIIVSAKFG